MESLRWNLSASPSPRLAKARSPERGNVCRPCYDQRPAAGGADVQRPFKRNRFNEPNSVHMSKAMLNFVGPCKVAMSHTETEYRLPHRILIQCALDVLQAICLSFPANLFAFAASTPHSQRQGHCIPLTTPHK